MNVYYLYKAQVWFRKFSCHSCCGHTQLKGKAKSVCPSDLFEMRCALCVFWEKEHPCSYDQNPPLSSTPPGWSTHFCLIVHLDTSSLIHLACAYQPWSIALWYKIILCGTFNSILPPAPLSGVISESFLMGLGANDFGKPIYSSISSCHVFMTFHNCFSKRNLVQVLHWLFSKHH